MDGGIEQLPDARRKPPRTAIKGQGTISRSPLLERA